MQLITSKHRNCAVALRDERHNAIAMRYGDTEHMILRFAPDKLNTIWDNAALCVRAGAPSVVMLANTYSTPDVVALLSLHLHAVMAFAGIGEETIDNNIVTQIAQLMMQVERFRTLNIVLALGFFQALKMGEYKLYGCRAIDIMNALQDYCHKAHRNQYRLAREHEKALREQQELLEAPHYVTYEQYLEYKKSQQQE